MWAEMQTKFAVILPSHVLVQLIRLVRMGMSEWGKVNPSEVSFQLNINQIFENQPTGITKSTRRIAHDGRSAPSYLIMLGAGWSWN